MTNTCHLYAFALAATLLVSAAKAEAEEFGTIEEAKTMLDRAIVQVKADKSRAFEMFNSSDPRFHDRDLFVFCFGARDGKFTAHESMVTHDVRKLSDSAGRLFGERMFAEAREGHTLEISYLSPFPGTTFHVPRRAFVTRAADQICGVSAYVYNGPGSPNEYVGSSPY